MFGRHDIPTVPFGAVVSKPFGACNIGCGRALLRQSLILYTFVLACNELHAQEVDTGANTNETAADLWADELWPEENTAPEAYVDQLIDPDIEEDAGIEEFLQEQQDEPPGYRFLGITASTLLNSNSGSDSTEREYSVGIRYQRETANYGVFSIDASAFSYEDEIRQDVTNSGGAVVINQQDFALSNNFMMDNTLGVHRILTDHNINTSRSRTSTPLILGLTTRASQKNQSFQLSVGKIGEQVGNLGRSFEQGDGSVAHLQYSRRWGKLWESTFELGSAFGFDEPGKEDWTGLQGTVKYGNRSTDFEYLVNTVASDSGEFALTASGRNQDRRLSHDYGLYYYGEDLQWLDTTLPSDRFGLYYSVRYNGGWLRTSGTVEANRTREEREGLTGDVDRLFTNVGLHYRRNLRDSLSLNTYYRQTRLNELRTEEDVMQDYLVSASFNRQHSGNRASHVSMSYYVDGKSDIYAGDINSELTYEFTWDTDYGIRTGVEFGYSRETTDTDEISSPVAGFSLDYVFTNDLEVSGYARYLGTSRNTGNKSDDWQTSINASMPFARNWVANLAVNYGQTVVESLSANDDRLETSENTHTVMFSVQYSRGGGSSLQPIGRHSGLNGSGSITGLIYWDENRDGIRQASEPRADGVEVYLDRRHLGITNTLGEFNFPSVYTGEHVIFVAEDTLPLPLTLEGKQDYQVFVEIRENTVIEIPAYEIEDF